MKGGFHRPGATQFGEFESVGKGLPLAADHIADDLLYAGGKLAIRGAGAAPVNYRWAVSADTLTLTHFGLDRCTQGPGAPKQHDAWDGVWTKTG